MKLVKTLGLVLVALVMFSCSSDDNSKLRFDGANLLGEHVMTAFDKREVRSTEIDGFNATITTTQKGDTFGERIYNFKAGGVVETNGGFRIIEVKTLNNKNPQESKYLFHKNETFDYKVEEGSRTLTIGNVEYKVIHFSNEIMRLRASYIIEDGDDTISIEEAIDFERK